MITDQILRARKQQHLDLVQQAREEADRSRTLAVIELAADGTGAFDPGGWAVRSRVEGGDDVLSLLDPIVRSFIRKKGEGGGMGMGREDGLGGRCTHHSTLVASPSHTLGNHPLIERHTRSCILCCRPPF